MAEDKKEKVEKILEDLEKLEAKAKVSDLAKIWKDEICNAEGQPFVTEINKLKKYFPCLECDGTSTDDIYGSSIFKDMKISVDDEDKLEKLTKPDSSAAKLFYAMSWKNGDFGKEHYIIDAFADEDDEDGIQFTKDKDGKTINISVFYQFGKFLKSYSEAKNNKRDFLNVQPIIDQHTFRAYLCLKGKELSSNTIPKSYAGYYERLPRGKNVSKEKMELHEFDGKRFKHYEELDYWNEYRKWYKGVLGKFNGKEREQAFWLLNHIMFVLGKAIKP